MQREAGYEAGDVKKVCVSRRGGADTLVAVFMIEDGEQDAVHRGSI